MQAMPGSAQHSLATGFAPAVCEALRRIVWQQPCARIALVGASKNAGKTTALNALVAAAVERLGLCSVGRDGEARDAWSDLPKPRVRVEKGTLVVTASACAQDGLLKLVEELGIVGPVGPVAVYEARAPGGVELAGLAHRSALREAIAALRRCGAARVIVDGAYHRQAAAHRDVADAVIVSVGAILGDSCTAAARLALPTLRALSVGAATVPPGQAQLVDGGLTDAKLPALLAARQITVRNPADVLLHARGWQMLDRAGVTVTAQAPVPLLCATTSPFRGDRAAEDPAAMLAAVASACATSRLPPLPLIDVVSGLVREVP
jgi:hypothetical protein